MQTNRTRMLVLLPLGLIALLGIALLAVGLFGGAPAQARSSMGELGSAATLRGQNIKSPLQALKRSNGALINTAGNGAGMRVAQTGPRDSGPVEIGVPAAIGGGVPGASAAAAPVAQGALEDILLAAQDTAQLDSYFFTLSIVDPFSGPGEGEGQYVAPDMAHVNATDPQENLREAIIVGEKIYVRNNEEEKWTLKTSDQLSEDETAATNVIATVAGSPNIFASLAGYLPGAEELEDQGEVELSGAVTRHYKFVINGNKLLDLEGDPFLIGDGEVFVDLAENRVYALNYNIDFGRLLQLIFGSLSETPTATPEPEATPEPPIIFTYNLRLRDFNELASFAEPSEEDVNTPIPATEEATATSTSAAARPTNTRRPTRTPTVVPTNTPVLANTEIDQMIGDAVDAMFNTLSTYHFESQYGGNEVYGSAEEDGPFTYNVAQTTVADVENPDKLQMNIFQEINDNGEARVNDTDVIRIGDDVYVNNDQTQNEWKKYDISEIGESALSTVIDPREVIAEAEQLDDEEINGVLCRHLRYTFDMAKVMGREDISGFDAAGGGEMWIAVDGGYQVRQIFGYYYENLETGDRVDVQWEGNYSAFDEPLDIQPPDVEEEE